jgi:hypothetical protein
MSRNDAWIQKLSGFQEMVMALALNGMSFLV